MSRELHSWEPIDLDEAYKRLSRSAFSIWIRMMTLDPTVFEKGRTGVSLACSISQSAFNVLVHELVNKGFLELKPRLGKTTLVILKKRCRIAGANSFVRV